MASEPLKQQRLGAGEATWGTREWESLAKSTHYPLDIPGKVNRGDRIRTCDLVLPKHPRYQAAPRPGLMSVAGEGRGIAGLGPRMVGWGLGAEA